MKLGYTILYVKDVEKTVNFYEQAFSLKRKFIHEAGDYGEMETGSTILAFASHELAISNDIGFKKNITRGNPPNFEIVFISDNVKSAYEQALKNGAIAVKNPEEKPWGQIVGYVKDLNGFLIEIASPMNT